MRNRVLQVKMVKPEKSETTESEPIEQFEIKAAVIGAHIQKMFGTVGKAVVAYIVVDTIRQVMVAKASR